MLLLVRYAKANDDCAALESHTLLKNHGWPFSVHKHAQHDDPFEILECALGAADVLCSEAVWAKSVGVLLNFGSRDDLHLVHDYYVARYGLRTRSLKDFVSAIATLGDFSFVKSALFIRSHFYGEKKVRHEDVVAEFEYLVTNADSTGTLLDVDVARDFYISLLYKKSRRTFWMALCVKNFRFIGRTSMNVEDAVFTANLCDIRSGMVVYDPCVGSGSLLLAPAVKGACVVGSDIDWWEMVGSCEQRGRLLGALQGDVAQHFVAEADRVVVDIPYGRRVSLGKEVLGTFIRKVGSAARRVLRRDGVLGMWAPVSDAVEIEGMALVTQYVQRSFFVQRSLLVFRKTH
ncbi:UNVERIFIED_CONTAM: hypothetical protein PYX00_011788 [Menopon gallinae]|uniref:Uncharacterized protein n=1 Tax=Menopon gallinae TaxID=328185 RepID=A0AAW2H8J4_9NEOP